MYSSLPLIFCGNLLLADSTIAYDTKLAATTTSLKIVDTIDDTAAHS